MINIILSICGLVFLILVCFIFSESRKHISWRIVFICLTLQFIFAFIFIYLPAGSYIFSFVNKGFDKVLNAISKSSNFLFGNLALPPIEKGSIGFILLFQAFPSIIFFASVLSALYYLKILSTLIEKISKWLVKIMPVSGAEILSAVTNIFVGIEAVLAVKPYLSKMTKSELTTVLTAGMATVASSVLAFYTFILKPVFPSIASHLISASVLGAPAAILISKMLVPEKEKPETLGKATNCYTEPYDNLTESLIKGAEEGMKMVAGIVAILLVFLSLLYFGNDVLQWITLHTFGKAISLSNLLSYLFYPFAYLSGIPIKDAPIFASLLGERLIATEVTSYQNLAILLQNKTIDLRTAFVASYALCGFAHFASMSIFAGGLVAIAPEHKKTIGKIAFKSLIAANLATLMMSYIVNIFYTGKGLIGP
ncbi:MAG: nucleoside transporter [Actinobacteria bacterium]|nr:nucleoside transporter [Actinomycetota bacterium]